MFSIRPNIYVNDRDGRHRLHEIVASIDGLMPAVSTALAEAKEEGGIKPKHIKQI